ncbi:MAG: hypothetical protein PF569_05920 [Candidatus Woesearchaeota archaeon]|jgi:hypothetical protein|nr:hypothetical protein [Candidatus Woesearchaeota archaeon]
MRLQKTLIGLMAIASINVAYAEDSPLLKDVVAFSNDQQLFEKEYQPIFDKICKVYRQNLLEDSSKELEMIKKVYDFKAQIVQAKGDIIFITNIEPEDGIQNSSEFKFFYKCKK